MDLAGNSRPLLGNSAAELRVADRAPRTRQQQPIGQQRNASPRVTRSPGSAGVKA